jgi:predicted protein tyrosine phosphatase
MIKNIYAVPRIAISNALSSALKAKGSGTNLLISIATYEDHALIKEPSQRLRLQELGYIDFLALFFADITQDKLVSARMSGYLEPEGFRMFSYDQGRAVKNLVDAHKFEEIDRLVVHCDQGLCRSGAVAAWAFRYLSQDGLYGGAERKFWTDNREITPNLYVANVLCDISGMKFNEDDFRY